MGLIEHAPTSGVILTGGASGIGHACAVALAEAGRPVALWDLNGAAAEKTGTRPTRLTAIAPCSAPRSCRVINVRPAVAPSSQ